MTRKYKIIGLTALLTTAIALPALAAYSLSGQPVANVSTDNGRKAEGAGYTLVDDDGHHGSARHAHERGGDDDDDDDGDNFSSGTTAPPPAAEPPANGLFNHGSNKPGAQIN